MCIRDSEDKDDDNDNGLYAYEDLDFNILDPNSDMELYKFGDLAGNEEDIDIENNDNDDKDADAELNWNRFLPDLDGDVDSLTVPHRSSDEDKEKCGIVIGTVVQQRQHKLIPSILMDTRITGIIQKTQDTDTTITQNIRQQQQQDIILKQQHELQRQHKQHDKYISTALQEQNERLQRQQKKTSKQNRVKKRKQQKQQKHKYRREQEQIKTRLGQDNKQVYQLETARQHSNKQQEYFEDFILNQSRAKDNPDLFPDNPT